VADEQPQQTLQLDEIRRSAKHAGGHIRADNHVHGDTHKAVVKSKGAIEARLHRWPTMSGVA
jgi:hypothetical protein